MSLSIHHVVFSALMHDIGKVIQRTGARDVEKYVTKCRKDKGSERLTYKHPMWTADFLDTFALPLPEDNWKAIIEIAGSHHCKDSWKLYNYDKYLDFVMQADHMASSWDRETPEELSQDPYKYYKTPLYSVFGRLNRQAPSSELMAYPLGSLSRDNVIPRSFESRNLRQDYSALFADFKREYEKLHAFYHELATNNRNFETDHFPQYIDAVDSLLWKYFWCVPANTLEDHPSSSLYHHLRNTATIAAALYAADTAEAPESAPFMIIAGDLNGIQTYLYDLNQENSNKASKLLRSRSFQIQMIMEMAAHRVIKDLSLSRLSIFSSQGGKWFILAPNSTSNKVKLQQLKEEISRDIFQRYLGTVSLNLSWDIAVSISDLKKNFFLKTMNSVMDALEIEKHHRFQSALSDDQAWNTEQFVINHDEIYHDQICDFCKRRKADGIAGDDYLKYEDPEDTGVKICRVCQQEIRLGRNLVKNNIYRIFHSDQDVPSAYISFANMHFARVANADAESLHPDAYHFCLRENEDKPHLPLHLAATHVPVDNQGRVKNFEEIAALSQGIMANAVLKGDVDNLGFNISRSWLQDEKGDPVCSITDYTTLSGMLNYFFTALVPDLQQTSFPDTIYTVYSGGDDFCLIGAYDQVIDFACQLRRDFSAYCAHNPHLHFSAAITLIHPKQPIRFSIQSTADKLETAKNRPGKNSLFLYETIANWTDVDNLLALSAQFDDWLKNEEIKLQFLYRLLSYHQMYLQSQKPECDVRNYLYESLLYYDIKRNIEKFNSQGQLRNPQLVQTLKAMTGLSEGNTMQNLRLPICHTLYKHRSHNTQEEK